MLRNMQGLHAPLKLQMELNITGKVWSLTYLIVKVSTFSEKNFERLSINHIFITPAQSSFLGMYRNRPVSPSVRLSIYLLKVQLLHRY